MCVSVYSKVGMCVYVYANVCTYVSVCVYVSVCMCVRMCVCLCKLRGEVVIVRVGCFMLVLLQVPVIQQPIR